MVMEFPAGLLEIGMCSVQRAMTRIRDVAQCVGDLISSYEGQQVSVFAPLLSWPVAASGFREFLCHFDL